MGFQYVGENLSLVQKSQTINWSDFLSDHEAPVYVYDREGIFNRLEVFKKSLPQKTSVFYAMKANAHPELLKGFYHKAVGVDVVSLGEMERAFDVGFQPKQVIFSGVGKSKSELQMAIKKNIKQINVESPEELIRIGEISRSLNQVTPVAFRLNPDVNPQTHPYICTGFRENKFGMGFEFLSELIDILKKYPKHIVLKGLTLHIGSQIRQVTSIIEAIEKTKRIFLNLKAEGWPLETFDIGGGVGIDYESSDLSQDEELIQEYGRDIDQVFKNLSCEILCEPGRILVGRFGLLFTQVQYVKKTQYKNFAIVNTGMHHLIRPSLYQAYHRILPVRKFNDETKEVYDIVGPICESSDVLGHERLLPKLQSGDWLAVADVGAYGYVMASYYNLHQLPKEYIF